MEKTNGMEKQKNSTLACCVWAEISINVGGGETFLVSFYCVFFMSSSLNFSYIDIDIVFVFILLLQLPPATRHSAQWHLLGPSDTRHRELFENIHFIGNGEMVQAESMVHAAMTELSISLSLSLSVQPQGQVRLKTSYQPGETILISEFAFCFSQADQACCQTLPTRQGQHLVCGRAARPSLALDRFRINGSH